MAARVVELNPAPTAAREPTPVDSATRSVVHVRQLGRSFDGRNVLRSLDLDIAMGEFVALLGRSGEGKSTLLRALAGLDRDVTGEVVVDGTVGVAFQDPRLLPWKRVLANVCLGLRVEDPQSVGRNALEEVGLTARQDAWPLTLSGGEAQRASLARALVRGPDLLLLDEPFCALDALTRMAMHELVLTLWRRHQPAVLMVTHDVDEALALANRVLVLRGGQVAFEAVLAAGRPRHRDDHEVVGLRYQLLAELGVDQKGTT
jgi:sulfonate transport system ATP-binding protein